MKSWLVTGWMMLAFLASPAAIAAPVSYTFDNGYFTVDTDNLVGGIWGRAIDFGGSCNSEYKNCKYSIGDVTIDGRSAPGNVKLNFTTKEVEYFIFDNSFISRDHVRPPDDPSFFRFTGDRAVKSASVIHSNSDTGGGSQPVPEPIGGYILAGLPIAGFLLMQKRRRRAL